MFMEKYYKLLGLNQSSSFEELKKSRNDLLKKYHPDYYLGNKKYAQEKTAKINEAYQKLKPIFEAKEEKEIEKFDEILGKNQTIKPNKKVVEKVAKFQPEKKKTINKTSISTEKTQKKEQTKKEKVISKTLNKEKTKKEKNLEKRVLDITIFVLGGIAILLAILFFTGVIK